MKSIFVVLMVLTISVINACNSGQFKDEETREMAREKTREIGREEARNVAHNSIRDAFKLPEKRACAGGGEDCAEKSCCPPYGCYIFKTYWSAEFKCSN